MSTLAREMERLTNEAHSVMLYSLPCGRRTTKERIKSAAATWRETAAKEPNGRRGFIGRDINIGVRRWRWIGNRQNELGDLWWQQWGPWSRWRWQGKQQHWSNVGQHRFVGFIWRESEEVGGASPLWLDIIETKKNRKSTSSESNIIPIYQIPLTIIFHSLSSVSIKKSLPCVSLLIFGMGTPYKIICSAFFQSIFGLIGRSYASTHAHSPLRLSSRQMRQ